MASYFSALVKGKREFTRICAASDFRDIRENLMDIDGFPAFCVDQCAWTPWAPDANSEYLDEQCANCNGWRAIESPLPCDKEWYLLMGLPCPYD